MERQYCCDLENIVLKTLDPSKPIISRAAHSALSSRKTKNVKIHVHI